jgi:aspartyl-tRNA(Asn)/glutamyl-tRNA(Gln) amidotransferase subunit B
VTVEIAGEAVEVGLLRLHLEEDAGKLTHEGAASGGASCVDLNRAGVPLIEIVTAPEMHDPREAGLVLERLRSVLRYAGVSGGNMERGELRCDANVSVRRRGDSRLGTRTELKNLNSFRNVQRAVEFEIERQIGELEAGRAVVQETVLWDASAGLTRPMRGKEEAPDYRYFPEPDLPPVVLDPAWIDSIRQSLPELPAARESRLRRQYGLTEKEAHRLTLDAELADYFERVAAGCGDPRTAAHFVLNDVLREQREGGRRADEPPVPAGRLAELIRLVADGTVSVTAARQELLPAMVRSGRAALELVRERGLEQLDDAGALAGLVRRVLAAAPEDVARYRGGKLALLGVFVGRVLQASGGRANPRRVRELLERELGA